MRPHNFISSRFPGTFIEAFRNGKKLERVYRLITLTKAGEYGLGLYETVQVDNARISYQWHIGKVMWDLTDYAKSVGAKITGG